MSLTFGLNELIAAFIFLLTGGGIVTMVAHKTGNLHFGKNKNVCSPDQKAVCKEHRDVIVTMTNITQDIAKISVCVETIKNTINETKEKIHEIDEKIEGIDRRLERHLGMHDAKK